MGLPNIGPLELIIILAIALLIVGPGRLPEMGNAIGRTIKEFRKASTDITEATTIDSDPKAASAMSASPAAAAPAATVESARAPAPAEPPAPEIAADTEPGDSAASAEPAPPPQAETAAEPLAAAQPKVLSGAAKPTATTSTPLPATPSEPKADGKTDA